MLAVLRIKNIIADRATRELTAKLGGSFQEVRRYLTMTRPLSSRQRKKQKYSML